MNLKLPRGTLDKLWSDPANWRGGIYSCQADPRIIVPKRIKWMGWTMNFAHRSAWIRLAVGIAVAIVPLFLSKAYDNRWFPPVWIAILIIVSVVTGRMGSSTARFEDP